MRLSTVLFILFIALLMAIGVAVTTILLIGPENIARLWQIELPVYEPEEVPEEPLYGPDYQKYYELKNLSCGTLSKDFIIVTHDVSTAQIYGLNAPDEEKQIVDLIVESYDHDQISKSYVLGDQMKKITNSSEEELTVIWKTGRVYECDPKCSMRLMNDTEAEEYRQDLFTMRNNCIYFAKTELPGVDIERLLNMEYEGKKDINAYRCDNFIIRGNPVYANSLLENSSFDEDQYALVWAMAHLNRMEECLDESTGIVVQRSLNIDLTDQYNIEFEPNGFFVLNQETNLTYYADKVPESFLNLPD